MNNRVLSAVAVGAFLIALAVGIIVWVVTDSTWTMVIWVTLLIFGIAHLAISFMRSNESGKFGPSDLTYGVVSGTIVAAIGLIGILYTQTDIGIWVLVAIFIIAVAAVGIFAALMNGKKEGK